MEKCMKDSRRRTSQIGACVLGILLVGLIGSTFLCHQSSNKVTLDEVKLKEVDENSGMFAIMLEKNPGKGDYEQSTDTTWPTEGYTFNDGMSGCLDSNGQKITDVTLSYEDGKVKVETGNTSYCYIYFDKVQQKPGDVVAGKKPAGLKDTASGGLRRFQGTNDAVENYICFGDTTCTSGDNHMYRIIGIETTTGRLKIMKEKSIGSIAWDSTDSTSKTNIYWNSSTLYKSLNGSNFLDNTSTYIPSNWKTLIDDTIEWKYGDVTSASTTGTSLYSTEQSWQTSVTARVGLIYLSDYYLSYSDTINCSSNYSTCKTSWMHQTNNGGSSSEYQWTMSRYGNDGSLYRAWYVNSIGNVSIYDLNTARAVRPVFYLTSDVKITGGDGKKGSPFTITL